MDAEDIIAAAELPRATASLCLRSGLVAQWEKLHAEWRVAPDTRTSLGAVSPKAELAAQMRALSDEMAKFQVTFVFEALPPEQYSALILKHPPVGDEKHTMRWNHATFEPALIEACLVDPVMNGEQVTRLLAKLSTAQMKQLGDTAYRANEGPADIPFEGAVYAENLDSGEQ